VLVMLVLAECGVGEHGAVDHVAEATRERSDRFFADGSLVGATVQERDRARV
jgi:hypothetical protein